MCVELHTSTSDYVSVPKRSALISVVEITSHFGYEKKRKILALRALAKWLPESEAQGTQSAVCFQYRQAEFTFDNNNFVVLFFR